MADMVVDLRPYGKLPALALWCFWGTCFYSFVAYQMHGERGKRSRKKIGVLLGLTPAEDMPQEEEWSALLDATTYKDERNDR